MVCAIIASVPLLVFALYSVQITRATTDDVKDTLGIARTLAGCPEIQRGLIRPPQADIISRPPGGVTKTQRPAADRGHRHARYSLFARTRTGADWPAFYRRSEPGWKERTSPLTRALAEIRVFAPVYDPASTSRSAWYWCISQKSGEDRIARGRLNAVWTILFSIFMSSMAIWGLVRVLKRILFGRRPCKSYCLNNVGDAAVAARRVLAVDIHGRVTMINSATPERCALLPSGKQTETPARPRWPACVRCQDGHRASGSEIAATDGCCCATWCR